MRDAGATGGNALPKDDPANVTRFTSAAAKRVQAHRARTRMGCFTSAAAKRVQAHRARTRMGLRCLTVRVNDRTVRHLISTGYLALESSKAAAYVAFALEAWISDNVT